MRICIFSMFPNTIGRIDACMHCVLHRITSEEMSKKSEKKRSTLKISEKKRHEI
jgi:hypothetical protein